MSGTSDRLDRAVRAVAILSRQFERSCLEIGLSLPQYRLLLYVRRGPQRAAQLAASAAVRRPTLTALVDGLEKEGLLERRSVEGDRRGIRLELTPRGLALLDRAEAHLGHVVDELAAEGDADSILGGLDELASILERRVAHSA